MWAVGHLNISEITVKGDQHIVQALTLFSLSLYIYIWDTYMCSILPECHWKLDVAHTYKTRYLITSCGDYWTKITVITLSGDLHSTRVTGLGTLVMVFYYVTKTFIFISPMWYIWKYIITICPVMKAVNTDRWLTIAFSHLCFIDEQ